MGDAFFWQSEYDSSLLYYYKALRINSSSYPMTTRLSTRVFGGLGNSYYYLGQVEKAYQNRMKVLELNRGKGDEKAIADSYYALAELDKERKQYEEAIKKVSEALELYLSLKNVEDAGYCYDLLSSIYFELKEYNKSLEYLNLACSSEFSITSQSQYHEGFCAHSLGLIHMKLNDFDLALEYLTIALKIQKESNQKEEFIQTSIALAKLKMLMGDCVQSTKILNQCLSKPIINKIPPIRQSIYKNLHEVSYHCGDYQVAFDFQKKYYLLRDSIEGSISKKELANLSSIYELDQKKQELKLLRKDKELNKLYNGFISIVFIILIVFIGIGSWFFKKQYYYNYKLRDQKSQIETQNKALYSSNEKLKTANVELENFAYIASHDLKAPLRTVMSYTGLLEKRYAKVLDQQGIEFLKLITDGVSHMHQLLDDILSYSNVEKGKEKFVAVNLNETLDKVLQVLEVNIQEQNAIIKYEKLPTILGNQIQVFQVLQNIIANAIKFMPKNVRPFIRITCSKYKGLVRIAVRDNGIGIEEKYQDRIFSLFKRLHSLQEYEGTGLGLSICKKIIEHHGGEIWVESDGESGTTFYFTFRLVEVEQAKELKKLETI